VLKVRRIKLEREIGESYPTALRMCARSGRCSARTTILCHASSKWARPASVGKTKWRNRGVADWKNARKKTMVLGMVERCE
jgi:hypothetical protein